MAVGLYLLWFFGYEKYIALDGRLDGYLTRDIAANAAAVLRVLGFDAVVSSSQLNMIMMNRYPAVYIAPYCDGMVLYALFSGFVIAFPTPSPHKLWFIPLGVVLIYSINVLRIVAMCINYLYFPQSFDFNHHYTFAFIVYGVIGMLWVWWATRLAEPAINVPSPYEA